MILDNLDAYLIYKQHVRRPVPSPCPRCRIELIGALLNDFTRSNFVEEAEHGSRSRPTIQPYSELRCRLSSTDEPKEDVRWKVSRHIDPASVLLLGVEDSRAHIPRHLIRDGDVRIDGRREGREVCEWPRELSKAWRRVEKR